MTYITLIGFAIIFLATAAGSSLVYFFQRDIPKRTNAVILGGWGDDCCCGVVAAHSFY